MTLFFVLALSLALYSPAHAQRIQDSSYRVIGHAGGIPMVWAAYYFFFF